jgi:RNA-directed DNA polymerase
MSENRQNQEGLALRNEPRGEALKPAEGTAAQVAKRVAESPAPTDRLMEEVVERENLRRAWKRVKANQGSPGVDGMTVFALKDYLNQHWPAIRDQLLMGTYQPQPVRRVEIEKPKGGVRKLGIPTVSANCTRAQFAFGMGGDPPSVPSASRPALPGSENAPNRRY